MDQKVENILRKLEDPNLEGQPFWNVSPECGAFLNSLVRLSRARNVLEIGTSNGYSGIYLAEALSHTGGKLYTVESHKRRFALAKENFEASGLHAFIEQVSGHAPEILVEKADVWNWVWDLVFLDATKMEYASYLEFLLGRIRSGGLIVADNVLSHYQETKEYRRLIMSRTDVETVFLPFEKGLAVSVKKNPPASSLPHD